MAFVCESKRIFHDYNQSTKNVGPGQYESPDLKNLSKTVAARVPFNSSNAKRSIYDKNLILENVASKKTGPGYYDIDYSFVKGNVKTYATNSSVIVKIDSLQSQEFKSKVPRFKSLQTDMPGPGEYSQDVMFSTVNFDIKKQSLDKRKKLKDKIHNFLTDLKKLNHISSKPSIPSKTLKLMKNSPNRSNQDGNIIRQSKTQNLKHYEDMPISQEEKNRKKRGFTWAKSERKLSVESSINSSLGALGPGKYYKQTFYGQNQKLQTILPRNSKTMRKKRAKTQSSTFKSKCPRTFFDQMMYETHSKDVAQAKEKLRLKTTKLGPGYYQIESPLSKKLNKNKNTIAYQFFGSTVQRFPSVAKQSGQIRDLLYPNGIKEKPNIDIASYNTIGQNKSYNMRENAFLSTKNLKKTIFDRQDTIPGPGEYQIQNLKEVFKPKKGKIIQNFGNSNERFPPGSISLKQQSIDQVEEDQEIPRKKKQRQSFMFKSKQKKQPLHINSEEDQKFGKYDVTLTDLSTKLKKQSIFLQNLKRIEVNVPGFNSANPRFEYHKKKEGGSLGKDVNEESQKQKKSLFLNTRTDKMRQAAIQKNKEQIAKSKKSTIYNTDEKSDRFKDMTIEQKFKTPGVGQYSIRSQWNKQTYNLKYHKSYVTAQIAGSNYEGFPFGTIEQITEEER